MASQQQGRRRVSISPEVTVHIISPRSSPELDSARLVNPTADRVQQAQGARMGIPYVYGVAPQPLPYPPPHHPALYASGVPPTPLLAPVALPPDSPMTMGVVEVTTPAPHGQELPLVSGIAPNMAWILKHKWNVRSAGYPGDLSEGDRVQPLCGLPEIVLRFTPDPAFEPFDDIITVAPGHDGKFVVTIGELLATIKAVLKAKLPRGRGLSDHQRQVLNLGQRYRLGLERPPTDRRVDMWGPGELNFRHLEYLLPVDGRRAFSVHFELLERNVHLF